MNFTYQNADLSTTIKRYSKDGYNYYIEYLDGTSISYTSYDEMEEAKILDIMLQQAIDRQNNIDLTKIKRDRKLFINLSLIFSLCSLGFLIDEKYFLSLLFTPSISSYLLLSSEKGTVIKELEKYKMFLEMNNDASTHNMDDKLFNYIESGKIYQIPLTVNTLDQYSYSQIKKLYKKMRPDQK